MYNKEFQITDSIGNNSFSYNKRKNPIIYIPKIINGNIEDLEIGNKIAFEDYNENNILKSCFGLKNFIRTNHPKTNKPIIIVDNHNHVFYFWYEALFNNLIKKGSTLIHIDQHKDTRIPERELEKDDDLNEIFKYTNEVLNVGNYIVQAIKNGLIKEVISITSEQDLNKEYKYDSMNSIILNIDMDFWSSDLDYIDIDKKNSFVKELMNKSDLITISTSPFFINQELAISILKKLLNE